MQSPLTMFHSIKDDYLRYYESPFALRSEELSAERRRLLEEEGRVYREPLVEVIPPFRSTPLSIAEITTGLGLPPEFASFVTSGLLPPGAHLYEHQLAALESCRSHVHPVVTSGTGSGKTEAFYLPIFASLIEESKAWTVAGPSDETKWWLSEPKRWQARRSSENRTAAMRALVLYPMNALVEDQLRRLRAALTSESAKAWYRANRPGHGFYFGHYTGRTPIPGSPSDASKHAQLAARLNALDQAYALAAGNAETRDFFPDPTGFEMVARWDMQSTPPDILITNYSMLNVMLMRSLEEPIFASTREWLKHPDHVFHLVVDELHMYRGTPGSEVAYLLRNLLQRLGLADRTDQLRIIATSASVETDEATVRTFLSQFFGQESTRFTIIAGERVGAPTSSTATNVDIELLARCSAYRGNAEGIGEAVLGADLEEFLRESQLRGSLTAACSVDGKVRAMPLSKVAGELFRGHPTERGAQAVSGALRLLGSPAAGSEALPSRVHLFFRNIQGFWACSDPQCSAVAPEFGSAERRIGKIFPEPRIRCECGSRVMELLYCQTCGDALLGAYRQLPESNGPWILFPDQPRIEDLPDSADFRDVFGTYAVYWPRTDATPSDEEWEREGLKFSFGPATLDPKRGELHFRSMGQTGYAFRITKSPGRRGASAAEPEAVPAFPIICPACGDNNEWMGPQTLPVTSTRRTRSSIRRLRTGFEKVSQVLADSLIRQLPDKKRKLVLFSDSRQDAARLAAGVEQAHYLDTVRLLALRRLHSSDPGYELAARRARGAELSPDQTEIADRFESQHPEIVLALVRDAQGLATEGDKRALEAFGGAKSLARLTEEIEADLLALGIMPAGPNSELATFSDVGEQHSWKELLSADMRSWKPVGERTQAGSEFIDKVRLALLQQVEDSVFASARRDYESLGLARVTFRDGSSGIAREVADSVTRILGERRRFAGRPNKQSSEQMPSFARRFVSACAERNGLEPAELIAEVTSILERAGAMNQHLLAAHGLTLVPVEGDDVWQCGICGRKHRQPSAGICTETDCLKYLDANPTKVSAGDDYYAVMATSSDPARLHTEELTGQTSPNDALARQRYFQDIFLPASGEIPQVDGVDVLSVTTTLEAGVDIGSLQAVLLANMPPMRFNYQQRVGRAGRREPSVSLSLTICRGRSHDDFYFLNPERITGDPPPPPYVDMRQPDIARRVIVAELLRRAFAGAQAQTGGRFGDNVHGQFGDASAWPDAEAQIAAWIQGNPADVQSIVGAILNHTDVAAGDRDSIASFLSAGLIPAIRAIAADPDLPQVELSERLANRGLLPMFGFPTRERQLYLEQPRRRDELNTIGRDLTIAVSEFAPGSEVVKDKRVYRSVGVAHYRPQGPRMVSDPDPLGSRRIAGLCGACKAIARVSEEGTTFACSVCSDGDYREVALSEPKGFRTQYNGGRPFDWEFDRGARAGHARLGADFQPRMEESVMAMKVLRGKADVYVLNEGDAGEGFDFVRAFNDQGLLVPKAFDNPLRDPVVDTRSLASITLTDVLVLRPDESRMPPGVRLSPSSHAIGVRAAWYSAAFMIRKAAALYLQIDQREVRVGVEPYASQQGLGGQLFLSDELENGAGYATHLGEPSVITSLLEAILDEDGYGIPRSHRDDPSSCDSSCYDCLRDYWNRAYHPLLDWRLGLDMTRLLARGDLDPAHGWPDLGERICAEFCSEFGITPTTFGPLPGGTIDGVPFVLGHPLWDPNAPPPALADAIAQAGPTARTVDYFEITRTPGAVFARILA